MYIALIGDEHRLFVRHQLEQFSPRDVMSIRSTTPYAPPTSIPSIIGILFGLALVAIGLNMWTLSHARSYGELYALAAMIWIAIGLAASSVSYLVYSSRDRFQAAMEEHRAAVKVWEDERAEEEPPGGHQIPISDLAKPPEPRISHGLMSVLEYGAAIGAIAMCYISGRLWLGSNELLSLGGTGICRAAVVLLLASPVISAINRARAFSRNAPKQCE